MMKFHSVVFSTHRFLGMLISLLFLMWFITGLVFIYHSFPNVKKQQIYEKKEDLPQDLPSIDSLFVCKNLTVSGFRLFQFQGQALLEYKDKKKVDTLTFDGQTSLKPNILNIARDWVQAPISRIDTLTENEQWIMYSRYQKKMPIYKIYFDDREKHQLYIASKTGEIQQFTNRKQRVWAWLGAIPHKLYFPFLRKNTDVWINTLTILGTMAFVVVLMGLILGIKFYWREYLRKGKIKSVYKKPWYLWHHISGTIFGIFLLGWAFSGAMSLQRVPQWLVKSNHKKEYSRKTFSGKDLPLQAYKLDYREILRKNPNVKEITWKHFDKIPYYEVVIGDSLHYIDASSNEIKELYIKQKDVEKVIKSKYQSGVTVSSQLMNRYDEYYMSLNKEKPLPVYKISIEDEDNSVCYFDPKTTKYKYVDDNRRAKKWAFSALHYLNFRFFVDKPLLWKCILWFLCIGGIIVSTSGVYLSGKYLRRKYLRIKRR